MFAGIEILLTPGHVPAHQSVMVRLPDTGNVVVCGDAIYTQDNLDHDNWSSQVDPEAAKLSGEKLMRIRSEENATLLLGHDPAQAKQFHRAPRSYR